MTGQKEDPEGSRFLTELGSLLDPAGLLTGADVRVRGVGWASLGSCQAMAIARPANTEEVVAILEICRRHVVSVVPLGGGTGLVEGAVAAEHELLLSLERMRSEPQIDPMTRTAVVDAGVTLEQLQNAADAHNLVFPLDLGARGSATIGGNIATNAGGNRVIRFGMMREMVLGLEVVLADGTLLSSLNRMLKNNAGYDLKQLFIGSEGTLGVITRACLRLREKWRSQNAALLSLTSFDNVLKLLKFTDARLGGSLSAFEAMWGGFYDTVTAPHNGIPAPLDRGQPYYVLIEALGGDSPGDRERFETLLAEIYDSGVLQDAAVAESLIQTMSFWQIRDAVEKLLELGPMIMFDVSLPISAMEEYVAGVRERLAARWPDHRCIVWGHLGDSNLHLWITVHSSDPGDRAQVEEIVYAPLHEVGGSISAEHGIGLEKRAYLSLTRTDPEISLMRLLKQTLDPEGILNPGKVIY
ncbi:MAG: FAD-binding oxidoreductase [Woeseia sp.]